MAGVLIFLGSGIARAERPTTNQVKAPKKASDLPKYLTEFSGELTEPQREGIWQEFIAAYGELQTSTLQLDNLASRIGEAPALRLSLHRKEAMEEGDEQLHRAADQDAKRLHNILKHYQLLFLHNPKMAETLKTMLKKEKSLASHEVNEGDGKLLHPDAQEGYQTEISTIIESSKDDVAAIWNLRQIRNEIVGIVQGSNTAAGGAGSHGNAVRVSK